MTMGWVETIRYIGLDLQVATVFAGASLDWAVSAMAPRGPLREAHVSENTPVKREEDDARP